MALLNYKSGNEIYHVFYFVSKCAWNIIHKHTISSVGVKDGNNTVFPPGGPITVQ